MKLTGINGKINGVSIKHDDGTTVVCSPAAFALLFHGVEIPARSMSLAFQGDKTKRKKSNRRAKVSDAD